MPRYKIKKPRRIAPRLANGERRIGTHVGLPPNIKESCVMIALSKGQSTSWALEQLIIRANHLEAPEYVPPKKKPEGK